MSDQLPLTCAIPNKRPVKTEAMRRHAAMVLAQKMLDEGVLDEGKPDEIADDIARATLHGEDGYDIAKYLDDHCSWCINMEITEALDGFSGILERLYRDAERVWGQENPREPPFLVGATVIWRGEAATIAGVYDYRPQHYLVRQGEMPPNSGGYVVAFEDVAAPPLVVVPNVL